MKPITNWIRNQLSIFQMSDKISLTICTMYKIKNIGVTELFRLRKPQFQLQLSYSSESLRWFCWLTWLWSWRLFQLSELWNITWILYFVGNTKADIAPLQEKLKNIEIKEFAAHPDDKQILEQGSSHKEQSLYSWKEIKRKNVRYCVP